MPNTQIPSGQSPSGNDLSDSDISLLCDIGLFSPDENKPERRARVVSLMERGYVVCSHADMAAAGATFMLTGKAQDILSERGAALNDG